MAWGPVSFWFGLVFAANQTEIAGIMWIKARGLSRVRGLLWCARPGGQVNLFSLYKRKKFYLATGQKFERNYFPVTINL
jgi:hypothetical protein